MNGAEYSRRQERGCMKGAKNMVIVYVDGTCRPQRLGDS